MLGAVLAGGKASRFGADKAQAVWNGQPLIVHILSALKMVVDDVIVVGRDYPGVCSLPDRPDGSYGPLGGLNAALHHARLHHFDAVLSVPCDVPTIDSTLLRTLADMPGTVFLAGLPVIGRWESALAQCLDHHLQATSSFAVRQFAHAISASKLDYPAPININCPADLAALHVQR